MGAASPSAPTFPAPPGQRWWQLGAGALLLGRLSAAACGLVQLPLALAHLGNPAFGLWLALAGLIWTLGILDCGLGFAVQNRITTLVAANRRAGASALVRRTLRWLLLGALAVLAIAAPLIAWGHWPDWFGVTDPTLRAATTPAVAIVFGAAALNLPLALATRLATALQEIWIIGLATALGSLLGLGAVAVAAVLGAGLPGFTLAACVLPLLPHVGVWWLLRRRHRWLFDAAGATEPDTRGLARESGLFFMPQLGAAFMGSFVPTLVTVFATPAAVAAFAVPQRLYGLALQLHTMVLAPIWPAYAHAAATGDAAFARRTFRTSWAVTAAAFMLPTLLLTPLLPAIVRLWLGAQAPAIAPVLLWTLAAWNLCQFGGQATATVLNGTGRMQSLALLVWVGLAVNLSLAAVLGPRWGATGVVVALGTPYLLLNLPVTAWQARRALREIATLRTTPAGAPAA